MVMITDDEQNMDSALWTFSRLKKWEALPTLEEDEDHLNSPEDERSLQYELDQILEIVWLARSSFNSAWSIYAAELLITYGGPSIRALIYLGATDRVEITSASLGSSVTIERSGLINLRDYLTDIADDMTTTNPNTGELRLEGPSY
jgi:hypothetical protein